MELHTDCFIKFNNLMKVHANVHFCDKSVLFKYTRVCGYVLLFKVLIVL